MPTHHTAFSKAETFGILFAEDFDDDFSDERASATATPVPEPEIIEPVFSAAELEAAKQEGFANGYAAALENSEEQRRAVASHAVLKVETLLERVREESTVAVERSIDSIAKLIFATIASLMPNLCARHDAGEIASLVRDLIVSLTPEQSLKVTVAPEIADDVRSALGILSSDAARRVAIATHGDMEPGDVRLAWDAGAASRSSRQVQKAIIAVLDQLGLLEPAVPETKSPAKGQPSLQTLPSMPSIERLFEKVASQDG